MLAPHCELGTIAYNYINYHLTELAGKEYGGQQLRYVSCAWIPSAFGVFDLQHVSAFWVVSGFLRSVSVLCVDWV